AVTRVDWYGMRPGSFILLTIAGLLVVLTSWTNCCWIARAALGATNMKNDAITTTDPRPIDIRFTSFICFSSLLFFLRLRCAIRDCGFTLRSVQFARHHLNG